MSERDLTGRSGLGIAVITCDDPDYVLAHSDATEVMDLRKSGPVHPAVRSVLAQQAHRRRFLRHRKPLAQVALVHANAYVNTGLNNALDREWGLGGTAIGWIGVDNNSTAVTATTTFLHGASAGTQPPTASANQVIKAISPAATRSAQTTTGGATFANADFTGGGNSVFVINKIGLLTASTDTGSALVDVVGGTAGSSPYNRTFVLDLTGAGTFSATLQIAVTAVAV